MGKIRVEELAAQMGIGSKEVLFLLQSIGVDVKSPQAALDESTVLAILQGKTHAPKQLIVRDNEARAVAAAEERAQPHQDHRQARRRRETAPRPSAERLEPPAPHGRRRAPRRRRAGAPPSAKAAAKPAEPARTAVVPAEPEPEAPRPAAPPVPAQDRPAPAAGARRRARRAAAPTSVRGRPAWRRRPAAPRPTGPARPDGSDGTARSEDPRAACVRPARPSTARRPAAPAPVRWAARRAPARRLGRTAAAAARARRPGEAQEGRQGGRQEDGGRQARRAAEDHRRRRGRPARVRRDVPGRHLLRHLAAADREDRRRRDRGGRGRRASRLEVRDPPGREGDARARLGQAARVQEARADRPRVLHRGRHGQGALREARRARPATSSGC